MIWFMDMQRFAEVSTVNAWNRFKLWWHPLQKFTMPRVVLNKRLKTTAGYAYYEPNEIHLSVELLQQHHAAFGTQIIPHEVGHIVCWHRWKHAGHGPEWKQTMIGAGFNPERLHSLVNYLHEERKLARMAGL